MAGYEIQRMLPRHFKILQLRLAGLTNKAIAEMVDCSPEMVGIVIRSPLFQAEYQRQLKNQNNNEIEEEVQSFAGKTRSILEQASEKAANTQIDCLDSEDDSVRLRASGSILDRVLGKAEGSEASGGPQVNIEIQSADAKLLIVALHESKELRNGEDAKSAADAPDAHTPENGQGAVHQAPQLSSGIGHRQAQAQTPETEVDESLPSSTVDPGG